MPDSTRYKTYLGDGAYADFDGYGVVLTTEDGIRATNRIVLEPEVLDTFEHWLTRLRERLAFERESANAR